MACHSRSASRRSALSGSVLSNVAVSFGASLALVRIVSCLLALIPSSGRRSNALTRRQQPISGNHLQLMRSAFAVRRCGKGRQWELWWLETASRPQSMSAGAYYGRNKEIDRPRCGRSSGARSSIASVSAQLRAGSPFWISAASTVFFRRQAIVIGPTPPGTGVMAPATLAHPS